MGDPVPVGAEAVEDCTGPPGEPVLLNIYDMFWTNDYTGNMGVGVYHSGVQVGEHHAGTKYFEENAFLADISQRMPFRTTKDSTIFPRDRFSFYYFPNIHAQVFWKVFFSSYI
jgi:hypothetical protein